MGGISSQYTQFEKVEIQTGYATYDSGTEDWTVTMVIKNSGSADATVNTAFLNDVPCGSYNQTAAPADSWGVSFADTGVNLAAGESSTVYVYINNGYASLSAGTTVNVKLHSAGGMDYIKLIRLP